MIDPAIVNNLFNLVQTVILAWIAVHPGKYYGSEEAGRMQRDGRDTD